jgi:hypothetical protein
MIAKDDMMAVLLDGCPSFAPQWQAFQDVDGDDWVREAAAVGLVESLENLNLHENGTDPEQFRPFLGPESSRWWGCD